MSPRWHRWLPVLGAAAAVLAVFFSVRSGRQSGRPASDPRVEFAASASTAVGEQRPWTLPDGTVLELNTDSTVDVRMGPTERTVRVQRGEVYFSVAHQAARPFVVTAAGVAVRDIGTVFDLRLRADEVDVLVTEGQVQVASGAGREAVSAGESVSISLGTPEAIPAVTPVDAAQADRATAWRQRQLEFDNEPLGTIAAEFNRYNRHKLVVPDAQLAAQRFGGSYPSDDYRTLVRQLQQNFGIQAEDHGTETILRSRHQ